MAKPTNVKKSTPSRSNNAIPAATPVRNTAIPKAQSSAAAKKPVTYEDIQLKAYFISISPQCGSEFDNWMRAERELKGL